jgi:hypothetical protein
MSVTDQKKVLFFLIPISSHLISSHLISSHLISEDFACMDKYAATRPTAVKYVRNSLSSALILLMVGGCKFPGSGGTSTKDTPPPSMADNVAAGVLGTDPFPTLRVNLAKALGVDANDEVLGMQIRLAKCSLEAGVTAYFPQGGPYAVAVTNLALNLSFTLFELQNDGSIRAPFPQLVDQMGRATAALWSFSIIGNVTADAQSYTKFIMDYATDRLLKPLPDVVRDSIRANLSADIDAVVKASRGSVAMKAANVLAIAPILLQCATAIGGGTVLLGKMGWETYQAINKTREGEEKLAERCPNYEKYTACQKVCAGNAVSSPFIQEYVGACRQHPRMAEMLGGFFNEAFFDTCYSTYCSVPTNPKLPTITQTGQCSLGTAIQVLLANDSSDKQTHTLSEVTDSCCSDAGPTTPGISCSNFLKVIR